KLHQPRGRSLDHLPKSTTVTIAIDSSRPEELSVVERVEGLQSKLKLLGLREPEGLEQSEIEIELARSIEGATRSCTRTAQRVLNEQRCVEVRLTVARIVIDV